MYLLLLLAQNQPTVLQVCPHPQTHWVGVFWGQIPGELAVSQAKILLILHQIHGLKLKVNTWVHHIHGMTHDTNLGHVNQAQ